MIISAQEALLQRRILGLDALERSVQAVQVGNARGVNDKTELLKDIRQQRQVLDTELKIREKFTQNAINLAQLRNHEKLKDQLRAVQRRRALNQREIQSYQKSKESCVAAARAAGASTEDPLDIQSIVRDLQSQQAQLAQSHGDNMAKSAALYRDGTSVADVCMPCLQKRVTILSKNAEHKQRALRSAAAFDGRQKHKDTCALMSVKSILLERNGTAPPEGWSGNPLQWGLGWGELAYGHVPTLTELSDKNPQEDMIDIGKRSGAYAPCSGTLDVSKILIAAEVPAEATRTKPSLEDIAKALDDGKGVVVGYDARPVWQGTDKNKWTSTSRLGHAVRVTAVDRAPDGTVRGFYINDSGSGKAPAFVSAEAMQMAIDRFSNSKMYSTIDSILPAIP